MAVEDSSILQAALKSTLVLDKGSDSPTFARATEATVFNHEEFLKTVPSGAARFSGARFKENLFSSDITNDWTLINCTSAAATDPDGGNDAHLITMTANTAFSGPRIATIGFDNLPENLVRFKFAFKPGTALWLRFFPIESGESNTSVWIDLQNQVFGTIGPLVAGKSYVSTSITTHTVDADWFVVDLLMQYDNKEGVTFNYELDIVDSNGGSTSTDIDTRTVTLAELGAYEVSGDTSNIAGEFVSKGVESSPWHGAGIDGAQWFATNKAGTAIADATLKRYLREPAATNLALHCRDATNAAWTKTNITAALTQTGIDNVDNTASLLTSTAANGTCLQAITTSGTRSFSAYVKRVTGTGTIEITRDNGTSWTAITSSINSSTYTRVSIQGTSVTNPDIGFRIVTSGDAIAFDYVQDEAGDILTHPILTTTASATRNADSLTYQTAGNFSNVAGAISAGVESDDWSNITGNIGSATTGLASSSANNGVQALDGTNTVNGPAGTPTDLMRLAIGWSGSTLKAASNGALGTSGSYDGSFNLSTIALGIHGNIRDLNVWTSALTDAQLEEAAGGASILSASGTGTASFISETASDLLASGVGGSAFVGGAVKPSDLTATGDGVGTFESNAIKSTELAAAGSGATSFVSNAIKSTDFAAVGAGVASLVGSALIRADLSSSGIGAASFELLIPGQTELISAGAGSASFTAQSTAQSSLSSAGAGAATFTTTASVTLLYHVDRIDLTLKNDTIDLTL